MIPPPLPMLTLAEQRAALEAALWGYDRDAARYTKLAAADAAYIAAILRAALNALPTDAQAATQAAHGAAVAAADLADRAQAAEQAGG